MTSIKYNVIPKNDPANPKAPNKYYPRYRRNGMFTTKQLAERLGETSIVDAATARAAFIALETVLPKILRLGFDVNIDGIGTLYLHIKSKLKDNPKDFTHHDMEDVEIRFRVDREFKKQLKGMSFEYVHKGTSKSVFREIDPSTVDLD